MTTTNLWSKRVERAGELAVRNPASAEILRFYERIAAWQEELFARIRTEAASGFSILPPVEVAAFQRLLDLVAVIGPTILAKLASERRGQDAGWQELLANCWTGSGDLGDGDPHLFFGYAFLQPYAERVRQQLPATGDGSDVLCPHCGHKPVAGVLREQGLGGQRFLLCSLCLGEWEFRRLLCPSCGEQDPARLAVYTTEEFSQVRVESCESCRTYLKSVDLTKDGHAVPLVDEIATAALDLWARAQGYRKLTPNLLGM